MIVPDQIDLEDALPCRQTSFVFPSPRPPFSEPARTAAQEEDPNQLTLPLEDVQQRSLSAAPLRTGLFQKWTV
jgi:hypothetical protein